MHTLPYFNHPPLLSPQARAHLLDQDDPDVVALGGQEGRGDQMRTAGGTGGGRDGRRAGDRNWGRNRPGGRGGGRRGERIHPGGKRHHYIRQDEGGSKAKGAGGLEKGGEGGMTEGRMDYRVHLPSHTNSHPHAGVHPAPAAESQSRHPRRRFRAPVRKGKKSVIASMPWYVGPIHTVTTQAARGSIHTHRDPPQQHQESVGINSHLL